MSLVSTVPAVAPAAAVVPDPILFDSGWKTVTGNNANTDLESITLTADGMVHIYAKMYRQTNISYYHVYSVYSGTSGNTDSFTPVWRPSGNKSQQNSSTLQPFTVYEASSEPTNFTSSMAADNRNSLGYPLEKDTTFIFRQNTSATTSYGIQYRIVVERSDGEHMVKWATNS